MPQKILCQIQDLVANSGVCALIEKDGQLKQIALFYLPNTKQKVFALDNWDPLGEANVLSRGMVGDMNNELVVASPLYKQHFSLETGKCMEEDISIPCYQVSVQGSDVMLVA